MFIISLVNAHNINSACKISFFCGNNAQIARYFLNLLEKLKIDRVSVTKISRLFCVTLNLHYLCSNISDLDRVKKYDNKNVIRIKL